MKKNIKIIAAIIASIVALTINLGETKASDFSYEAAAKSIPGKIIINSQEWFAELFIYNGEVYYKLQDLAASISGYSCEFDYSTSGHTINIIDGREYTLKGNEYYASTPGFFPVTPFSSEINYKNKVLEINTYLIKDNVCISAKDFAKFLNIGVCKALNKYKGYRFETNFNYANNISKNKKNLSLKRVMQQGNISYNLGKGGYAVYYKGYVFFISNKWLYRMDNNGKNVTKLNTKAVHSLNAIRDRIYFVDYGNKVSSISIDGKDKRTEYCPLYFGYNQEPKVMTYINDYVYVQYHDYRDRRWSDNIYRYSIKGEGESQECIYRIYSDKKIIRDMYIDNNYIYFNINWFNRKNLNALGKIGDKNSLIETHVLQPFKYKNKVYYKDDDDNKIYYMQLGTKNTRIKVSDITVNRFHIVKDKIVYQKQKELFTMDLYGKNTKSLNHINVATFNTAGDWIIYYESLSGGATKAWIVNINGTSVKY